MKTLGPVAFFVTCYIALYSYIAIRPSTNEASIVVDYYSYYLLEHQNENDNMEAN